MRDDYFTNTEADAGHFARHYAEPDDDCPSLSDLADDGYIEEPGEKCPPHEFARRGMPGNWWRECWLCGTTEYDHEYISYEPRDPA